MAKPARDALSPQEIAERSGFHPRTILREIERGRLNAFEPVKGDYRVLANEYERWLQANPVKPRRRQPSDDDARRKSGAQATEAGSLRQLRAIG